MLTVEITPVDALTMLRRVAAADVRIVGFLHWFVDGGWFAPELVQALTHERRPRSYQEIFEALVALDEKRNEPQREGVEADVMASAIGLLLAEHSIERGIAVRAIVRLNNAIKAASPLPPPNQEPGRPIDPDFARQLNDIGYTVRSIRRHGRDYLSLRSNEGREVLLGPPLTHADKIQALEVLRRHTI